MKTRIWMAVALACALALAGCAKHHPTAPAALAPVDSTPLANSPTGAIQRFVWAWNNRDTTAYDALFTDDFAFVFALTDSSGRSFSDHPWNRMDEAACSARMFHGGADVPPVSAVALTIDDQLAAAVDGRPGHQDAWHKTVRTHVDLKLTVVDATGVPGVTPVVGYALFYLTRGDSAVLSAPRVAAGGRDSTRWYIDRWEDETVGSQPSLASPEPTRSNTWGSVKSRYLGSSGSPR